MGKTPKVPPPPPPTAEETALMKKQTEAIDKYLQSVDLANTSQEKLSRISEIASGIYDPVFDAQGNLTGTTLNQKRLATLREDVATNEEIGRLQAETYMKALKGELPVSAATVENKKQEFKLLKENAARRGINIFGETAEEAAANPQNSTSASEAVKGFVTRYGLIEDSERRGNFSMGYSPLGTQAMGYMGASSETLGQGAAGYSGVVGAAGAAMQPYQHQRDLQFQVGYQNALNRAQRQSDIAGLIVKAGTTAATASTQRA